MRFAKPGKFDGDEMARDRQYSIGVDVGGTFVDCVVRERGGSVIFDKAFTTHGNLAEGVVNSLRNAASRMNLSLERLLEATEVFKLGTTSPVNRLINRAGAKTAFLTTRGHEDAITIGRVRQKTDGLSDAERSDVRRWRKADPIVAPILLKGINERIDSFGHVLAPLNEAEFEAAIKDCLSDGAEAFAVCFLWSFLNPVHEQAAKRIIGRLAPNAFTTLSSEIAPYLGEYERGATTVLNSYLGPGTAADLHALEGTLRKHGLRCDAFVMQSSGGVVPADDGIARPVYLLASGPVGGVAASQLLSAGYRGGNVIATDMGGTSFDVGVVAGGKATERAVSLHNRYRVFLPTVEVTSIGAGGGSIAVIDPVTNVLQVGPRSAGSTPGPVCYGFGGTEPTVTDANAVLGRLNPDRFFAGRHRLDVANARRVIDEKIATPLGSSPEAAAEAILRIVDSRMADLIRTLTIERGHDPRDFAIVAYGGGGPLHVGSYAREIGAHSVVIPRAASAYSAWGITDSPIVRTYAQSAPTLLPVDDSHLRDMFGRLQARAHVDMKPDCSGKKRGDFAQTASLFVDMRYRYQIQELRVPLDAAELAAPDVSSILANRFEALYEQRFGAGSTLRAAGVEASTFRLVLSEAFLYQRADADRACRQKTAAVDCRNVWFDGAFASIPIYDADAATTGFKQAGPCIVEGGLITTVVHPGQTIAVDGDGNFVLSIGSNLTPAAE
jgi:N-methylhydantoinase A